MTMTDTVRTRIGIEAAQSCPAARASTAVDESITGVRRATTADADGKYAEDIFLDASTALQQEGMNPVFRSESRSAYRFERRDGTGCVCERIERHGCPVFDITAHDGTLFVSFHAPDIETIREIVADLRAAFDGVTVQRLSRESDDEGADPVLIDRNVLTDRQREVLETAWRMGYFEHSRQASATEVANELDIALSTFTEHLAAAQRKVLDPLLDP
ncbi:MAG: helix-turn-helix domain-containing protein [Halobacteriaceae archaeon]